MACCSALHIRLHEDIRSQGGGRFSHWYGCLFFSTSDGTDPRVNGRAYVATGSARSSQLVLNVVLLADAAIIFFLRRWILALLVRHRRMCSRRRRRWRMLRSRHAGVRCIRRRKSHRKSAQVSWPGSEYCRPCCAWLRAYSRPMGHGSGRCARAASKNRKQRTKKGTKSRISQTRGRKPNQGTCAWTVHRPHDEISLDPCRAAPAMSCTDAPSMEVNPMQSPSGASRKLLVVATATSGWNLTLGALV